MFVKTFGISTELLFSITSYADRSNVFETAAGYFKSHFLQAHKKKDVSGRVLWMVSCVCIYIYTQVLIAFFLALYEYVGELLFLL